MKRWPEIVGALIGTLLVIGSITWAVVTEVQKWQARQAIIDAGHKLQESK